MTHRTLFIALIITLLTLPQLALAADRATEKEAVAMVQKAVAHFKADGEKAFSDFTAPSQQFVNKDLYITVYDMGGKCLAHGQNAKQVGKDLLAMKDPDGVPFVKNRVDLAKQKGTFWQEYKFTDPLSKEVLPKKMYCETAGSTIICGGVYKQ